MARHPPHTGRDLLSNPSFLLITVGALIGVNFPLGKIAGAAAISPILWAGLLSFGASAFLLPFLLARGRLSLPRGRVLRYVAISGSISFVVPNLLLFSVIPHTGAGYAGLMFALSPVFTLTYSLAFRMRPPNALGLIGIAVGFVGAAIVALTRGASPGAPEAFWIVAALLIPASLAAGNVYRTLDWPGDESPDSLAFWSHAFAVLAFVGIALLVLGNVPVAELGRAPVTAFFQALAAGLTFPLFFRLQQHGGPVLLSQIGYVAAAVGLGAATLIMGEVYALITWTGAAIIGVGIAATIVAQQQRAP